MSKDNLVELGVCAKPHGIKGGFTFHLQNVEDSVLTDGSIITLFPKNSSSKISESGENYTISKISFGNKTIVYLQGVDDRNLVEELIPFIIKIERASFPEIETGEYYISDLVGIDIYCPIKDKKIGVIKNSYDNGAQIVFEVKLLSGECVDIPFVEQFFKSVDLKKRVAKVVLPRVVE